MREVYKSVLSDVCHKLIMTKSETLIFVPLFEHTLQLFAMWENLDLFTV